MTEERCYLCVGQDCHFEQLSIRYQEEINEINGSDLTNEQKLALIQDKLNALAQHRIIARSFNCPILNNVNLDTGEFSI